MRQLFALAAIALVSGGCGVATHGVATVWVTRDRGAHVMLVRSVPAGLTAMQALERVASVSTRYAGRFVESIDGVQGSLTEQRDWFYFVNGYEADRSAAEYRLREGDVEWWDFRSWNGAIHEPVVVGAFPEPFVHGYDGRRLPSVVAGPATPATRAIARLVHAVRIVHTRSFATSKANLLIIVPAARERFSARLLADRPGAPVVFTFWGDPERLARDPALARFRYTLP